MKHLLIALLLIPIICPGQEKNDHLKMAASFVKYYNSNAKDSICSLFADEGDANKCLWKNTDIYSEYGRINKYQYIGIDPEDKVAVFKVDFANKGTRAISFTLRKGKFETFRFDTTSEYIDKNLSKTTSK